jgi:PAS domain-containing protein
MQSEYHHPSELAQSHESLQTSERRFRELVEALPAAIYMTDANGRITFFNHAAVKLWGHSPRSGEDRWCGSWRLYLPNGTPLPHSECPMAIALKEDRQVSGMEAVALGIEFCSVLELLPGGQALLLRAGSGWREGLVRREVV